MKLKSRCFLQNYGILHKNEIICGKCPINFICGERLLVENPNSGITNFDNFLFAWIQVMRIITFSGWTKLLLSLQQKLGFYIVFYFLSLIIVGNFFLIKLMFAVLKVKFVEYQKIQSFKSPINNSKKNITMRFRNDENSNFENISLNEKMNSGLTFAKNRDSVFSFKFQNTIKERSNGQRASIFSNRKKRNKETNIIYLLKCSYKKSLVFAKNLFFYEKNHSKNIKNLIKSFVSFIFNNKYLNYENPKNIFVNHKLEYFSTSENNIFPKRFILIYYF